MILLELNKIFRFLVCARKKHKDDLYNLEYITKAKRPAEIRKFKNKNKSVENAEIFYKDVCGKLDKEQ